MPAPSRPRLRLATGIALSCLVVGTLASCGDDVDSTPGSEGGSSVTPSQSQSQAPEQAPEQAPIEITLENDTFEPKGERIEVAAGEPVKIVITADRAGELHVHSTPEQEIAFTAGVTEHEVKIDQPGVVEVESHDPALVVLQLEVR